MRASEPSNRMTGEASRIARPELLLPLREARLGRHAEAGVEPSRAGDRLGVHLEDDAAVSAIAELREARAQERLADAAAAVRPADAEARDVAQGGVAVRRREGDQDAGELRTVPRELPEVGLELRAGVDMVVEPRILALPGVAPVIRECLGQAVIGDPFLAAGEGPDLDSRDR